MKIKNIEFKEGDMGATPSKITAEMDVKEALWIALIAGKTRNDSNGHSLWSALVGDVFNRYWQDGTNDARKEFPMEVPPVKYED